MILDYRETSNAARSSRQGSLQLADELLGIVPPQAALFVPITSLLQFREHIIVASNFQAVRIDVDQSPRHYNRNMKEHEITW